MIPRKLHFIFISTPAKGGLPFYFCYWAAVRSAMRCNPGYEVNLWYEEEPASAYFRDLANEVRLRQVKPPEEVFGNPVPHYAHKSDILRLQILLQEGGVYLDLDTVTVRSFDPLLPNTAVMSLVKNDGRVFGLGNSVIMGAPGNSFMRRWYDSYRTFRSRGHDEFYDEHGAGYSMRLAQQHPEELTLLDETAFLTPDMTPRGIAALFLQDGIYPNAYCHHLWGKNAQDVIESLSEWNVGLYPGLYTRQVQTVIGDEIQRLRESGAGCDPSRLVPVVPRYASVPLLSVHEIQRRFAAAVISARAAFAGKGIVTTVKNSDVAGVWVLLRELARMNVQLPVEAWSIAGELSEENQSLLSEAWPNLRLRVWGENMGPDALKYYALCYSSFQEVMWLDNGWFPLRDPSSLFADPGYEAKGSLFWLCDGEQPAAFGPAADIWKLYGMTYNDCVMLGTSVFLVDKARCLPQVLMAAFMRRNYRIYDALCGDAGEAGCLRFAWQYFQLQSDGALRHTGYLAEPSCAAFGFLREASACNEVGNLAGARPEFRTRELRDRAGKPVFSKGGIQLDTARKAFSADADIRIR